MGSSLRPGWLGISTRMVILIRTHTKKYTKGDSIKKFFAGYVGWLTRTICTKIGDNWINGTGNIDWFVFPTPSLLENKMRKNVFSVQKWLIWGENKRIFPGGMNKITFHQLNQRFSVSISVRRSEGPYCSPSSMRRWRTRPASCRRVMRAEEASKSDLSSLGGLDSSLGGRFITKISLYIRSNLE